MTITLERISSQDFAWIKRQHVEAVSIALVKANTHTEVSAASQAERNWDRRLPAGAATPDNHLFHISESSTGSRVGYLWFAVEERDGSKIAFIYGIAISSEHRHRGYGHLAMMRLEKIVESLGVTRIVLNVRGDNEAAIALYRSAGYSIDALSMSRSL